MSSIDYQRIIAELEDQRVVIDQAIAAVRALVAGPGRQVPVAASSAPSEVAQSRPSLASPSEDEARVLAALAGETDGLPPGLLAQRVRMAPQIVRGIVRRLEAEGRVEVIGSTTQRRVHLT